MKQIFNNVAHSSSHMLEPNAMQILFDIMIMGLKYQVQQVVQPEELLHITRTHLRTTQAFVPGEISLSHIQVISGKFEKLTEEF